MSLTDEQLEQIKALESPTPEAIAKIVGGEPDKPADPADPDDFSKLPERTQREIKALRDENAKHRNEKNLAKAALEAEQRKALEEQGKYKELFEKSNAELEALKKAAQEASDRAKSLEDESRKELIARLPADKRKGYDGIQLDVLRKIVTDFVDNGTPTSPGAKNGTGNQSLPMTLDGMTDEQMQQLATTNPPYFQELIKKTFTNKIGQ